MATKPDKLPEWALTDTTLPQAGTQNKLEPSSDLKNIGFDFLTLPEAQGENWWRNRVHLWIEYASLTTISLSADYFADSGAADALVLDVVTNSVAPIAYVDRMSIRTTIAVTNTGGAATLNLNALGVKSIVDQAGATLSAGDLTTGKEAEFIFDNANDRFIFINQDPTPVDASTTVKGIVELATSAETITGTDTARAVTPAGLQAKVASTTAKGIVELATDGEADAGSDTTRAITPSNLPTAVPANMPSASTSVQGKVELATNAETITGTDTARAVTPAGLQAKVASTTVKGIVELATNAETQTGSDATRAVTPAGLASLTATETRDGLIELATQAEVDAGSDAVRAVTPATLAAAATVAIPTTLGAVNTYAHLLLIAGGPHVPGTDLAGSGLKFASAGGVSVATPVPAGTWRVMGYQSGVNSTTVMLRIS